MTHNDSDEMNVIALLEVAWHYKYLIAAVSAVCAAIAVVLALTATTIYHAEVVLTDAPTSGVNDSGALASRFGGLASLAGVSLSGSGDASREAQAVLHSRHLAEEFIKRNGVAPKLLSNSAKQNLWFAVDIFRKTVLTIHEEKDKGTTTVAIDWRDAAEAAQWANEYVALANEIVRTRALDESSRNIKYLSEQILKTDVLEIQRAIYNLVESETKVHMLANTRREYAFTVVDPAVTPESRSWPRRTLMVLTGGVLGVLFGVFLALAHNQWRRHQSRKAPSSKNPRYA